MNRQKMGDISHLLCIFNDMKTCKAGHFHDGLLRNFLVVKVDQFIHIACEDITCFVFSQNDAVIIHKDFKGIVLTDIQVASELNRERNSSEIIQLSYNTCAFHQKNLLISGRQREIVPAENKKRQPKQVFRLSPLTYIFICVLIYHLRKKMSTEIVEIFQYVGGKYIVIPGCRW